MKVDERRCLVEQMTLAGMTAERIAEHLGVSGRTVVRDRAALGVRVPAEPLKHGRYRYSTGCRCGICQEWNTARVKDAKARRIARGAQPQTHGANAYINYDCRCEVCVAEHSAKCRAWYRKTRSALLAAINAADASGVSV